MYMYICSSASSVSALSLYGSIHVYPQITRRHCRKFSVAPMSILTSQNNSTVSSSVVHTRALAGCQAATVSSTVSVGWICLYHVSAHSSTCLRRLSSQKTWVAPAILAECSCKSHTWARQYTGIQKAFQGVHGSREPCRVRQTWGTW